MGISKQEVILGPYNHYLMKLILTISHCGHLKWSHGYILVRDLTPNAYYIF